MILTANPYHACGILLPPERALLSGARH